MPAKFAALVSGVAVNRGSSRDVLPDGVAPPSLPSPSDVVQTSLTLCSMVLITVSIRPVNTCLARLRV